VTPAPSVLVDIVPLSCNAEQLTIRSLV